MRFLMTAPFIAVILGACGPTAPATTLSQATDEARQACAVFPNGSPDGAACVQEWARVRMGGQHNATSAGIGLRLEAANQCVGMGYPAQHPQFSQCVELRQRSILEGTAIMAAANAAARSAPAPSPVIVQSATPPPPPAVPALPKQCTAIHSGPVTSVQCY